MIFLLDDQRTPQYIIDKYGLDVTVEDFMVSKTYLGGLSSIQNYLIGGNDVRVVKEN
jgi:hypothetical protein